MPLTLSSKKDWWFGSDLLAFVHQVCDHTCKGSAVSAANAVVFSVVSVLAFRGLVVLSPLVLLRLFEHTGDCPSSQCAPRPCQSCPAVLLSVAAKRATDPPPSSLPTCRLCPSATNCSDTREGSPIHHCSESCKKRRSCCKRRCNASSLFHVGCCWRDALHEVLQCNIRHCCYWPDVITSASQKTQSACVRCVARLWRLSASDGHACHVGARE